MKKTTYITFLSILLFLTSCHIFVGKKNQTYYIRKKIAQYPTILGFEKKTIVLPKLSHKQLEEDKLVEIFATKTQQLDCNHYELEDVFVKKTFPLKGLDYYIYDYRGKMYSSDMNCPDTLLTPKIVKGESLLFPYHNQELFVFYVRPTIDVKYTIWNASKLLTLDNTAIKNTKRYDELTKYLAFFPLKINGMRRKVIYLPQVDEEKEQDKKVEIVMGKYTLTDNCNQYNLIGKIEKNSIMGMDFAYYIIESNGEIISTRKACQDDKKKKKFVTGATRIIDYNSSLPIVLFVPKGIEVRYKIWQTDHQIYQ